jgi:hypothetical protein
MIKLAVSKNVAKDVAAIVTDNFDKLPENVRNELQKRLTKQ